MTMEVVYWGTALASLVAVWLNIKQQAACFLIWGVTNATWAVVDSGLLISTDRAV